MQRTADPLSELRHEHVVPRKVIIDLLNQLSRPSVDEVFDLLSKFLIGGVVHPLEDEVLNVEFRSSMPPEFFDPASPDFRDPWLRYKRNPHIKVVQNPQTEIAQSIRGHQ